MINSVVTVVFGFVVVKLGRGDDVYAGQAFAVQDGAGIFAAADESLGDDFALKVFQFFVNAFQTTFFFDFHNTDAAAFGCRFNEHGQAELLFDGIEIGVFVQNGKLGNGQPQSLPNQFAAVFVHADG